VNVPSPPAGVPESKPGVVPVHIVSCPCAGMLIVSVVIPGSTVILMSLLVLEQADDVTRRLYQVAAVRRDPVRSSAVDPDMAEKAQPSELLIH